jgi:hypothetical protein
MFGDCQGNLCAMDVAAILAAERGMPITAIEKGPRGSWLLAEEGPRHGPQVQLRAAPISLPPPRAEVIVVGGGAAGQAAAEAVRAGGGTVILLDRASGWTVTGLVPSDDGWVVLAQSRDGSAELVGTSAVLATGGYIEPREHRVRIAGPRPAGIMTAELATAALQAGYLPGRVTVLIGRARATEALEGELTAAGIRVSRLPHEPEEVAGTGRLEAVRFGDRWVPADTLIFADRRVASNFLLRGLGLVDGRPGIPAPTDHEGRLPLPGLYAAGCCVRPDLDHAACGQDGAGVGARAVAEVGLAQKPMRTAR